MTSTPAKERTGAVAWTGFSPGAKVVVEEVDDTDFASIPRVFVWFLPRYGRYTLAAIYHVGRCPLGGTAQAWRVAGLVARSVAGPPRHSSSWPRS
jgi:hypothetical protein